MIQVKSRAAAGPDRDKEARWIEKHSAKALRQADGTIRHLKGNRDQRLTSERGRGIAVDGSAIRWIGVAVIDHPDPPEDFIPALGEGPNPAVVLLRRDWEFLFDQLKSIHAVVGYLRRVAGESVELGTEPVRYYEFALADAEAAPSRSIRHSFGATGYQRSAPLLPLEPAASEDVRPHLLVRAMFEDIATTGGQIDEDRRLRALAELDRLPVSDRAGIGQFLVEALATVMQTPEGTTEWRFRRLIGALEGERTAHLAFAACSEYSAEHQTAFGAWVQLRHHEMQQIVDDADTLTTVGVFLTPRHDGARQWDTTMVAVSGDLGLTAEELELYRSLWRSHDDERHKSVVSG